MYLITKYTQICTSLMYFDNTRILRYFENEIILGITSLEKRRVSKVLVGASNTHSCFHKSMNNCRTHLRIIQLYHTSMRNLEQRHNKLWRCFPLARIFFFLLCYSRTKNILLDRICNRNRLNVSGARRRETDVCHHEPKIYCATARNAHSGTSLFSLRGKKFSPATWESDCRHIVCPADLSRILIK